MAPPRLAAVSIERVRGSEVPSEVIDYLREREPAATGMLAVLLQPPESRQQRRMWLVRRGESIAGVLLSVRYCRDRWTGMLLLDDLSCAQEMATALDHSNIWSVVGPAAPIEAVAPLAKRRRRLGRTWFHFVPYTPRTRPISSDSIGSDPTAANAITVRPASSADLMKLVALYAEGDRAIRPPWRRVRTAVRQALPYTLVADSPEGILGAIKVTPGSEYAIINRTVVDPSVRGGRVAFGLLTHATLAALAQGKGFCGFRAEPRMAAVQRTMRSSYAEEVTLGKPTPWTSIALWPPKRFRGQNKMRWLWERVEDRLGRPADIRPRP